MSNKISTIVTKIKAAADALVASGVLRIVKEEELNVFTEPNLPALSVTVDRFKPSGGTQLVPDWTATFLIFLADRRGSTRTDQALLDRIGEVDAVLAALADSAALGGTLERGEWVPFGVVDRTHQIAALAVCAACTITVKFKGPLKT